METLVALAWLTGGVWTASFIHRFSFPIPKLDPDYFGRFAGPLTLFLGMLWPLLALIQLINIISNKED